MKRKSLIVIITSLALLAAWATTIRNSTAQAPDPQSQERVDEGIITAPDDKAPGAFPVQGRLTDASGNPLNGNYTLLFSLYEVETGGSAICSDSNSVTVTEGLFNSYVDNCYNDLTGQKLWLGVQVGADAEMTPRQVIYPVPYALAFRPGAYVIGDSATPILEVENANVSGRGLRAYATSVTGTNYAIVGAAVSPDGYGGYFYNNGGGVGLLAKSTNGNALKVEGENAVSVLATNTNNPAVWATSVNAAGVHGASGYAPGVDGYSINGPGVYGESLSGVAIAANGAITSTAPTYLWISGNDVVRYEQNNSTVINLMSNGGAVLERGADTGTKYVVLPVTIAGTLYGQNVRVAAVDIYWQGETSMDALVDMRLRRQTGACWACYEDILYDSADYTCPESSNPQGCTHHHNLSNNNILTPDSGILYLMVGFGFSGPSTDIRLGGARLTLEYDE